MNVLSDVIPFVRGWNFASAAKNAVLPPSLAKASHVEADSSALCPFGAQVKGIKVEVCHCQNDKKV